MVNTVDIKVGKFIRDWVVAATGSDIVNLDKRSNLWEVVKRNLKLLPGDYRPISDRTEYISIGLPAHGGDIRKYDEERGREIEVNTLYRCCLSELGTKSLIRYFESMFHLAFVVFMTARFSDESKEKIVHAITAFLQEYNLPIDNKILSRLMKYWYRYRVKYPEENKLPIFF